MPKRRVPGRAAPDPPDGDRPPGPVPAGPVFPDAADPGRAALRPGGREATSPSAGLQHPGLQHPGLQHPGLQHPGLEHPGLQGSGPQDPGHQPARSPRRAGWPADLLHRIQRPLTGAHQVAVMSLKGGVGRTTTAALLGLAFAEHRADRVVVLDAAPAGGTLAERLLGEAAATGVRELLTHLEQVHTPAELARFGGTAGRLRVLGSDQDLRAAHAFHSLDYERVCLLLQRHFSVIVTDGTTGPAAPGVLAMAHSVVVVGSLTVDGAGRADAMLDRLSALGYRDAAARAVLVLDGDRASAGVDASGLRAHFRARCRAVVDLPHDPHLARGAWLDPEALAPATREAALELATLVADEFGAVGVGRG